MLHRQVIILAWIQYLLVGSNYLIAFYLNVPPYITIMLFGMTLAMQVLTSARYNNNPLNVSLQVVIISLPMVAGLYALTFPYNAMTIGLIGFSLVLSVLMIRESCHSLKSLLAIRENMRELLRVNNNLVKRDPLTGLINRFELRDLTGRQLREMALKEDVPGILWVNIDRFGHVNRAFGEETGDIVLCEIADRISNLMEDRGSVSRYGGDEFLINIESASSNRLEALAREITEDIARPILINGRTLWLSASAGAALGRADDTDADVLIGRAGIALRAAKSTGLNGYSLYEENMHQAIQRRYLIENELGIARLQNEIEVVYQPIVDVASGSTVSVEALARWSNPRLGRLGPDEFIPVAEQNGMIEVITDLVVSASCREMRNWPVHVGLNINLAPVLLERQGVIERIAYYAARNRLAPSRITIELTEDIVISHNSRVTENLDKLLGFGFKLAIDDFGTGYSSLENIYRVPVSTIKLDKSFALELTHKAKARSIIRSMIGLCDMLRLETVVEGIETEEQLNFIRKAGCRYAQGFYFSEPKSQLTYEDMLPRKSALPLTAANSTGLV